jgi:hypothetical protein
MTAVLKTQRKERAVIWEFITRAKTRGKIYLADRVRIAQKRLIELIRGMTEEWQTTRFYWAFRVGPFDKALWRRGCNSLGGATRYQVVYSTERCQAVARVRKAAAKFQALAVIPRLQALFLVLGGTNFVSQKSTIDFIVPFPRNCIHFPDPRPIDLHRAIFA